MAERLFTTPFVVLGLADLAYFTAAGVGIYALPLYVTGPVGSDEGGSGIAFGAFAVSALLLRPLAGRLSDTWGRRPLLVGGALLCALSLVLLPYAGTLPAVVGLRVLLGVAEAAFFVAGMAALIDLAPPARMGEAVSYNSLGLYLGLSLGSPLGESLVRWQGYTAAWVGSALLAAIAAALAVVLALPRLEQAEGPAKRHGSLVHRASLPISLAFLASVLAMGGFLSLAALRAEQTGLAAASLPLTTCGAVVVVCRVAFARLPDRLAPLSLGRASLLLATAGLSVVALTPTPVGLVVGAAILGLGVSFSTPAFFAAIFAAVPPQERGAASGTASAAIDLGLGLGPIALGQFAAAFGLSWAFGLGALVALAGGAWVQVLRHRLRAWPGR